MNFNDQIEKADIESEVGIGVDVSRETSEPNERRVFDLWGFLKKPPLDEPIEKYINNPINRNKDEDFAQGLRGVSALFGCVDLAILDLWGFIRYASKKRGEKVGE